MIVRGYENKEIAKIFDRSKNTIKNHVTDILYKFSIGETENEFTRDPSAKDIVSRTQATMKAFDENLIPQAVLHTLPHIRDVSRVNKLTKIEMEVLRLVAKGYANKQIALRINISQNAVKDHMTFILLKLNCQSRTEAAVIFRLHTSLPREETIYPQHE